MNTKSKIRRRHAASALFIVDSLFFGLTNPKNVAVPLLIVGFLLFVASFYCLVRLFVAGLAWYGLNGLSTGRRASQIRWTVVGVVAVLLALQSTGELSLRDILILLPLSVMGYFYSSRTLKRTVVS